VTSRWSKDRAGVTRCLRRSVQDMSGMDLPKHVMPRLEARDTRIGYGKRKKYRRSASEIPAFSTESGTVWGSAWTAAPRVVPACDGRQGDEQLNREHGRYIRRVWGLHHLLQPKIVNFACCNAYRTFKMALPPKWYQVRSPKDKTYNMYLV
jgi:hypothetical protein